MNHVDLRQEQLLKLDYENNFDQAYNQVNELMINNLIDDQQATMQKGGPESKEHQHYLLLGGGECFSRSPAGSQRKSQDRTVDAEAVRELEQDVGNESNTGECKQKQEVFCHPNCGLKLSSICIFSSHSEHDSNPSFQNMLADKLHGTDPEDVIVSAFKLFDPDGKGVISKVGMPRVQLPLPRPAQVEAFP